MSAKAHARIAGMLLWTLIILASFAIVDAFGVRAWGWVLAIPASCSAVMLLVFAPILNGFLENEQRAAASANLDYARRLTDNGHG